MSGHSKWATIRRAKEKTDAQRGKIFTKIGREIAVAVKLGGADINTNSKLYDVIAKAKQNNMPNDNIQRSIKKASGELSGVNYEEVYYEGYGAGGSALLVQCLTDNKNRTAGDVRHLFDRQGNGLGTSNSVAYLFERKAVIEIENNENVDSDNVFECALNYGADDVEVENDIICVSAQPTNLKTLTQELEKLGLKILLSEVQFVPGQEIELDEQNMDKFMRLVDALEELDDVQNVYHNVLI